MAAVCVKVCGKKSRDGSTFREHTNTRFIIFFGTFANYIFVHITQSLGQQSFLFRSSIQTILQFWISQSKLETVCSNTCSPQVKSVAYICLLSTYLSGPLSETG